jgi:Holliday junction resolvase RusA-like endonuclease
MTQTPTRLAFRVVGTPRPQPRPRFNRNTGRVVSTGSDKAKLWRAEVERVCRAAVERLGAAPLFVEPVRVTILFTFNRTKITPGMMPSRKRHLSAEKPPIGDVDNLAKLAMDVMERSGVFGNDRLVSVLSATKVWGDQSSMAVMVEPLGAAESVEPEIRHNPLPKWLKRS